MIERKDMEEDTGAEVIEMRRTEDGLGFNIRGGRDSEYVQFRLIHKQNWFEPVLIEPFWSTNQKEDNGIFVSKIRERGTAAEVRILTHNDS